MLATYVAVLFRGAQLYNDLPSSIRVLKNLTAFRRACISFFLKPS